MSATIHTFPTRVEGSAFTAQEVATAHSRALARSARWGAERIIDEGREWISIGPFTGGDAGAEDRYFLGIVTGGKVQVGALDQSEVLGDFDTVEAAMDAMDAAEAQRWRDG